MEKTVETAASIRTILIPLALTQFVASFAASNMNVAINNIATDLGTDVSGVQTAITLFTLTMAALMIPGSKLTDIWGRKFCLRIGLIVYGVGALISALAQAQRGLVVGYSFFEGVGSALMIPPVYILTTVLISDLASRARAFGVISGMGGIGSASGPLIGGLITTLISWRASFIFQALIVLTVFILARRIADPGVKGEKPAFDLVGAILSSAGLFFIVVGILQSRDYGWFTAKKDFSIGGTVIIPAGGISPVWLFIAIGAGLLLWFFLHIRSRERAGKEPLLSTRLFQNRTANLGLVTQCAQWFVLLGSSFVISVFLQTVMGYNAIQTGLILTPATIGLLISSARAGRMARRFSQTVLVRAGFILTVGGILLMLLLANNTNPILSIVPGLFILGVGVGIMLTSSVNIVQGSFPEKDQGEISGLSRSVSNLGSSLGTAIAGSILVSAVTLGNKAYSWALIALVVVGLLGLLAALMMPTKLVASTQTETTPT
jgi:MFS family permease